jgi:hypothetical protein
MIRGGEIDGNRILAEASLRESYEKPFHRPTDPDLSALGWHGVGSLESGELLVHGAGGHRGFVASITYIPEPGIGLVVLSNGNDYENYREELALGTITLMLETKTGVRQPEDPPVERVAVDKALLKEYCGTYLTIQYGDLRVYTSWLGRLKLAFGGHRFNLTPESRNSFRITHPLTDVGYLTLSFFPDQPVQGDIAVLNLQNKLFEVGRRRRPIRRTELWDELVGNYVIEENEVSSGGTVRIEIVGEFLRIKIDYGMYDYDVVLDPQDEREIVMVDGHYAGETLHRDPETGDLSWSGLVATPVRA